MPVVDLGEAIAMLRRLQQPVDAGLVRGSVNSLATEIAHATGASVRVAHVGTTLTVKFTGRNAAQAAAAFRTRARTDIPAWGTTIVRDLLGNNA